MTDDLTDLEAKARAATPGRWRLRGNAVMAGPEDDAAAPHKFVCVTRTRPDRDGGAHLPDAYYIQAAQPSVVLSLIARIRELEAENAGLRAE